MANGDKAASLQTYNSIKADIIRRRIRSGTPLVEDTLAKTYHVSRTPVREALKWLESDGLVIYYPYKGCFVKDLGPQDMAEIYVVRQALEGICCRLAAASINDNSLQLLRENQEQSEAALAAGDPESADRLGNKLHDVIITLAGNSRISDILQKLRSQAMYFSSVAERLDGRLEKSIREHGAILSALEARDGALAEQQMRAHLQSTLEDMLVYMHNNDIDTLF